MYGIEDKLLSILYSLLMLVLAIGVRVVAGTFLIPAGLFALAWFSFTFFPLILLFTVPINSMAVLYILLAVLLFCLSAVPFNWSNAFRRNLSKSLSSAKFDSGFLRSALYISALASVSLSVVIILMNGIDPQLLIFDLVRTSGKYAAARSLIGLEYGPIGVLNTMFTYLCPVLGGLRVLAPSRRWFFVVSISPSILIMVTQSTKLSLLVSLCFYLAATLIARIYANLLSLPKVSEFSKLIFGAALMIPFVMVSFVSRLGKFNPEDLAAIYDPLLFSITSYTLGQIYAFADFFSFAIGDQSVSSFQNNFFSNGAYTFSSIFDMLGMGKNFPPGMYYESGWFRDLFETNIFTFFRGLIYDFGVIGSLLFVFIVGIVSHVITLRLLSKKRDWLALSAFLILLVFIFMGYLFSVFTSRYVFLVGAATFLLLSVNAYLPNVHKKNI